MLSSLKIFAFSPNLRRYKIMNLHLHISRRWTYFFIFFLYLRFAFSPTIWSYGVKKWIVLSLSLNLFLHFFTNETSLSNGFFLYLHFFRQQIFLLSFFFCQQIRCYDVQINECAPSFIVKPTSSLFRQQDIIAEPISLSFHQQDIVTLKKKGMHTISHRRIYSFTFSPTNSTLWYCRKMKVASLVIEPISLLFRQQTPLDRALNNQEFSYIFFY